MGCPNKWVNQLLKQWNPSISNQTSLKTTPVPVGGFGLAFQLDRCPKVIPEAGLCGARSVCAGLVACLLNVDDLDVDVDADVNVGWLVGWLSTCFPTPETCLTQGTATGDQEALEGIRLISSGALV